MIIDKNQVIEDIKTWKKQWHYENLKDINLIARILPSLSQEYKNTLLISATVYKCLDTVKLLINNGANDFQHAFQKACQCGGGNLEMVDYFATLDIDIPTIINNSWSNIILGNNLDIVKRVIELGGDIHFKDDVALHYAVRLDRFSIAQCLLENDANVHANDDVALVSASVRGHYNIVKLLLNHNANVHAQNEKCLAYSIFNEDDNLKYLLIQHGADINRVSKLLTEQKIKIEEKTKKLTKNQKKLKKINTALKTLSKVLDINIYDLDDIRYPREDCKFDNFLNLCINVPEVKSIIRINDLEILSNLTKQQVVNIQSIHINDIKFKQFLNICNQPLGLSQQPVENKRLKI